MTEILLSAHRLSWTAPLQHGSHWDQSKVMLKVRDKVLQRDDYTCQGCGWKSLQFQEIHHRNHDHSNFKESNLETLCPLCHQVFHPASASVSGGGYMIWLPEMSQEELNRLLIGVFVVLKTGTSHPLFQIAKSVWGILETKKVFLENHIGKSDPGVYGQLLLRFSPDDYDNRKQTMGAIKMLANPTRFETEIEFWRTTMEKDRTPSEWVTWAHSLNTAA